MVPTKQPTLIPTAVPSANPTVAPTSMPSINPSKYPTYTPTEETPLPTMATQDPSITPTRGTDIPSMHPSAQTAHPSFVPTGIPTQNPSFVPTDTPTQNPIGPTQSPTQFYGRLWFICYYEDNDVDYYNASITIPEYAQIMIQQVLDTIHEVEGHSVNYSQAQTNANSAWKRGGIRDFTMCNVFEDSKVDITCPSYEIDEDEDTAYAAIGTFDVVALDKVDVYTDYITNIMEGDGFRSKFNTNMNTALSIAMNITRRRSLLAQMFHAKLIEIRETEVIQATYWISSTETAADEGTGSKAGIQVIVDRMIQTAMVYKYQLFIGVGGATVLCCVCIFCCVCYKKRKRRKHADQRHDEIQNKTLIELDRHETPRKKEFEPITPIATPSSKSPMLDTKGIKLKKTGDVPKTYKKQSESVQKSMHVMHVTPMGLDNMIQPEPELEQADKDDVPPPPKEPAHPRESKK
eukprot:223486_1